MRGERIHAAHYAGGGRGYHSAAYRQAVVAAIGGGLRRVRRHPHTRQADGRWLDDRCGVSNRARAGTIVRRHRVAGVVLARLPSIAKCPLDDSGWGWIHTVEEKSDACKATCANRQQAEGCTGAG
jgi:hypothetical protein